MRPQDSRVISIRCCVWGVERPVGFVGMNPVPDPAGICRYSMEEKQFWRAWTLDIREPQDFEPPEPGDEIAGRYRVGKFLGRGEYGIVYAASDLLTGGNPVAIKLFPALNRADRAAVSALAREVLLMNRVEHPNIARFFDVINSDGWVGYSMELVLGLPLSEILGSGERMSAAEVRQILTHVCWGTQAMHDALLLHGDLKTENIMLTGNGTTKIVDFGLSQELKSGLGIGASITGSADYISPEAVSGAELGPAADVYAIGVIGYLLVTARTPFGHLPVADSLRERVRNAPLPAAAFCSDFPPDLLAVIDQALLPDPSARHQSARAMSLALAACKSVPQSGSVGSRLGRRVVGKDMPENRVRVVSYDPPPLVLKNPLMPLLISFAWRTLAILFAAAAVFATLIER